MRQTDDDVTQELDATEVDFAANQLSVLPDCESNHWKK